MAFTPTDGDDTAFLVGPGTANIDFKGGVDTLHMGTEPRNDYRLVQNADGSIRVSSVSSASGGGLNLTVKNLELITFSNGTDTIDLRTFFGDNTAPTASLVDDKPGASNGNVTYTLNFNEAVSGLAANDFTVINGSVSSITGSGASYTVVVTPAPNAEGNLQLTLKVASVTDAAGNSNMASVVATAQPIDTRAPTLLSSSPASASSDFAVGSNLVFNFSEAVQKGSGSVLLRDSGGTLVASYAVGSSGNVSIAGSTLTLNPSLDLAGNGSFSVELGAGAVVDAVGNTSALSTTTFRTANSLTGPLLLGGNGHDTISLSAGQFNVDGGAGIDTAVIAQPRASFTTSAKLGGFNLASTGTGTGTGTSGSAYALTQVERVQFSDGRLALDVNGAAGTTAKILGAVFGAATVKTQPDYVGIGLSFLDRGTPYESLMQLALDARLGVGASHARVVTELYTNVVGVAPPAADLAFYTALLDNRTYTPAALGMLAADTDLNLLNIDLVGLATTGITFIAA